MNLFNNDKNKLTKIITLIIFVFLHIIFFIYSSCSACVPDEERQALIDLHYSEFIEYYYIDNGKISDICTWYGIHCTECHVVEISSYWMYSGDICYFQNYIPESFGNLQYLSILEIEYCKFNSLPESFGNHQNLSVLALSGNLLNCLPDNFGNLQNLSLLCLDSNQLNSLPESFGNLQNLSELYLSDNQFNSLPENFGNLQNLSELDLSNNQLNSLPESFGNLQNLLFLELSSNLFHSLPENFGNLQNLLFLELSSNLFHSLPESFGNLQNLSELDLSNNQLNSLPESFGNLQNLSELDLSNNNQLISLPESFGNLQNLSSLYLEDNQLISLPESFGNLQNLSSLYLEDNQLISLPESFGNLQNLSSFYLEDNPLISLPESFGNLQNLSVLYLSNNQLNSLPESFGNLQNLSVLYLSNNQLNSLPESFDNLQNLRGLFLSNNQLNSLPESFGNLQNIEYLYLSNNQLNSLPVSFCNLFHSLPESFGNFPTMTHLDLSNNQLNSLPENFGNLQNIWVLVLSNNQLNSLPESFGNLQNIQVLLLSNNQLNSLPESFGNFPKLSHLYLSNNQLNSLPESFGNFPKLSHLYLSNNQLNSLPESFGNLQNIFELDLSQNQLNCLPENIENLINLKKLIISDNNLSSISDSIGKLFSLEIIELNNNSLSELPKSVNELSNLQKIYLSNNSLSEFPYALSKLTTLQELDLSNNSLGHINDIDGFSNLISLNISGNYGIDFNNVTKIKNLQYLNVSNCNIDLNEYESSFLSDLVNLKYFYFDDNHFFYIPHDIDRLKNLLTLSISQTDIGTIPKSLYNLTNLRYLNIFKTHLYVDITDIPVELSKLKNLKYINLSETGLYTSSPALAKFISERSTNWENIVPDPPEREGLTIHYITTNSDAFGYSLNSTISIVIVFTEPVTLKYNNLIVEFDTGQNITISPFSLSYSATGLYTVNENDFSDDLNVTSIKLESGAALQNAEGVDVNLSLPPEGNLRHIKNVYVDGTSPTVSFIDPSDNSIIDSSEIKCFDILNKIHGKAGDRSGDYSIIITIKDKNGLEIFSPASKLFYIYPDNEKKWEVDTSEVIWQENMEYTITAHVEDFAGNTKTESINITIGKKDSTITCELSKDNIIVGELPVISGKISPSNKVFGKKVYIDFKNPFGGETRKEIGEVKNDGSFEYFFECDVINNHFINISGIWTISTYWEGNDCLEGSSSNPKNLTVSKANCKVYLDSTYNAVKKGDKISIGGKFEPDFDCGYDKNFVEVTLLFNYGSETKTIKILTEDIDGHFALNYIDFLDKLGDWTVQATIETNAYETANPDVLKIKVVETAGYAIIVQGKVSNDEGIESHNKTANFVYRQLKQRGLIDEDIIYFNYNMNQAYYKITDSVLSSLDENEEVTDSIIDALKQIKNIEYLSKDEFDQKLEDIIPENNSCYEEIINQSKVEIEVDNIPSKDKIEQTIKNDIKNKMENNPANLYVVMIDHGVTNKFYIDNEVITADDLSNWYDELEQSPGWNQEIITILGFCFSGSFIKSLSKENRIIITSAGEDEFSYKGALDADGIREGEFFIAEFFKGVSNNKSLYEAFTKAVVQTEIF